MTDRVDENYRPSVLKAFLEHRKALAGYLAKKLLDPSDIDDLLQDTFISAFEAGKKQPIQSPKAYLFIVARNLLSKKFAQQAKTMAKEIGEAEFATLESQAAPADQQLHYQLKMEVLDKAVNSLPPQCRRVFLLRKIYGYSHKEISVQLGISTSTVERHITMALTRVNVTMLEHGYNQSYSGTKNAAASHLRALK